MDVKGILDDLEEYIENGCLPVIGRYRPFRQAFFLDVDAVLDYTHQMRVLLTEAEEKTREKEQMLAAAQQQAEHIIREAAERADDPLR